MGVAPSGLVGARVEAQTPACRASRWVLVYFGARYRPHYPVGDLVRYLAVVDSSGTPTAWLTTGAILLDGKAVSGRPLSWAPRPPFAEGTDWTQYLDSIFAPAGVMARLDSAVGAVAGVLGARTNPYDVTVMIPYPDPRIIHFEFLGRSLDFGKPADRLAGVDAYMRELVQRFTAAGYRHLRLTGLYWLPEGIFPADLGLMPLVAAQVHRAGLQLLWIPDFFDFTHKHWLRLTDLGFDHVFYQPNFFIDTLSSKDRIDSSIALARVQGAGIEVEFDERMFSNPAFARRLEPYLSALRSSPDLVAGPLAMYEGGGMLPRLADGRDSASTALYRNLTDVYRVPGGVGCN